MNELLHRWIRHGVIVAVSAWAGAAVAQEDPYPLQFPGPVDVSASLAPLPQPAPVPAVSVVAQPSSNQARSWLAPQRGEAERITPSSGLGAWALVVLLGLVGGAWWLQRRKRGRKLDENLAKLQINVLANNRIGPKAHAVVVEFGGKVLVLGVTDSHVSCLDSVTREELAAARAAHERDVESSIERPAVNKTPASNTFQAYLDRNLEREVPDSAALRVAESTLDRAQVRGNPREELLDIEGQAAGLAARLRKGIKSG